MSYYNGGASNYGNMYSGGMSSQYPQLTASHQLYRNQMPNQCQPEMTPDAMTDFNYMQVADPQQLYLQSLLHQQINTSSVGMRGGGDYMQQESMYQRPMPRSYGGTRRRNGLW